MTYFKNLHSNLHTNYRRHLVPFIWTEVISRLPWAKFHFATRAASLNAVENLVDTARRSSFSQRQIVLNSSFAREQQIEAARDRA